ncbi:BAI1-associated protein 3 isoform X2 [Parasteatoda tepidariorum]|uniref:BAI1-associated protein 3 isoform X2 n=1 Tax=Parasteatoda tepidariorum TaxID=114398 RepID=UPI0039BCF6A2
MAIVFNFFQKFKEIPSFLRTTEESVPDFPEISQDPGYLDGEDNWVPDSDENFFEAFTALSWMRENNRFCFLRKEESEKHGAPPKIDTSNFTYSISEKEWEDLYVEVLYTIKHKIGANMSNYSEYTKDLYEYAQETFGMSKEEHEKFMAVVHEEKPPIPVLNVTVVEARGLEAKDPNGFSDPYCMLGIQIDPGEKAEGEEINSTRRSFKRFAPSMKRKEKRERSSSEVLPAKFIRTTTVKKATLNPVWREKFRLDIDHARTDRLHLDIWDHDDETSVFDAARKLNEVSNLKGLGRYFKEVAQSARRGDNVDDFLGCVNLPLEEISAAGVDRWFRLRGRTNRSNVQGQIHLKLKFGTREDRGIAAGNNNLREIREHQKLFWIFMDHELRKFERNSYEWSGEMPQQALLILHQHALQGDITDLQQSVCQWLAIYRKHKEVILDYAFLYQQLEELSLAWDKNEEVLSMEEEGDLSESLNEFVEHCIELLRHHRKYFTPHNTLSWHRMKFMMKSLSITYLMNAFKEFFPFRNDFHVEVSNALKKSNTIWMEEIKSEIELNQDSPNSVHSFIQFIDRINYDLNKAEAHHHHLIESILFIDYLPLVFKQTGKQIYDEIVKRIGLRDCDDGHDSDTYIAEENRECVNKFLFNIKETEVFELYLALRDFSHFKKCLHDEEPANKALAISHMWFIDVMCHWFCSSRHKLRSRILVSISHDRVLKDATSLTKELDFGERNKKVDLASFNPKCSTSALDTVSCFSQLREFWMHLAWPDEGSIFPFVYSIIQAIVSGVVLYANAVWKQLREECNAASRRRTAQVSKKVILSLNNIATVLEGLQAVEDGLNLPSVFRAYGEAEGKAKAQECQIQVEESLHNAQRHVERIQKVVLDRFSEEMNPVIRKLVFHVAYAPDKLESKTSVKPLVEYLQKSFTQIQSSFVDVSYQKMVLLIWEQIIEELKITASSNIGKEKTRFFQRLHTCLDILFDYFDHNGEFRNQDLKTDSYLSLERELQLQRQEAKNLIELYYSKRIQDQERSQNQGSSFGSLVVKAYYNDVLEILSVEVINARDLRACDPNGLSDPFVILKLIPRHVFPNSSTYKTKVHMKTLDPVFLEYFEWSLPWELFESNNGAINLVVMDFDFMRKNDFEGEAFLRFDQLEFINTMKPPEPIELNLTVPDFSCSPPDEDGKETAFNVSRFSKGDILNTLETRPWDNAATTFLKSEKFKHL